MSKIKHNTPLLNCSSYYPMCDPAVNYGTLHHPHEP